MDWTSTSPDPRQGGNESAVEEDSSNITSHMSELCSDETDNAPSLQLHTLKEFEKHLNDLKKENFSLKLRIYFLEERIQQKYEESSEDVYRSNIELKVEVESLKQDLQEKQQLLDKALKTAESLTNHNEAELQRRCQERQQEIDQMQQVLETKIQLLQEEAQLARSEADRMASLTGSQSQASLLSLDTPMDNIPEEDRPLDIWPPSTTNKDRLIEELTKELRSKEALITELTSEKNSLTHQVGELEGQVQELSSFLQQKDKDVDFYQEELGRERLRIEEEMQMKETCRICGRELCGNQRRWIFHPTAKLNLQVLLSHALGQEVMRDGRGEFACSKCTFMLDRMYRFDTVIARVEALSIERLQRLLQEKHRLRQCIGGLYRKNNSGEATITVIANNEENDGIVDISGLTHAKYCALLQEDLVYSFYESWAEDGDCHHHQPSQCPLSSGSEVTTVGSHRCSSRRCRGCSHWRVADSDYEAVCKVPRKLARSISCGPSTRYSASVVGGHIITGGGEDREKKEDTEDTDEPPSSVTLVPSSQAPSRTSDSDRTLAGRASSSPSVTSLEPTEDRTQQMQPTDAQLSIPLDQGDELISDCLSEEPMETTHSLSHALSLLQTYAVYRPVHTHKGSKLPVLIKQFAGYRDFPISLTNSVLGMFPITPEAESEPNIATPEPPAIRLNAGTDLNVDFSSMGESLEELFKEYPQPPPHQSLVEEQQSQLNQYECAAGQCVSELQKAQLQVQSLQAKFHESEANNMKLQEKLNEMECELRSLRQSSQSQERTIQGLNDCINTKDNEAQELYQMLEGQNATLCKLREMVQRSQSKAPEGSTETLTVAQLQDELVAVQSSLFSLGLELEASQRSLRQSQRREADLLKFKDRLDSDLQEAVQHREVTVKHNQTLNCTLQKTCSELQNKEAALKETEAEQHRVMQEKERTIVQLRQFLEDKERHLQEYSEMLESLERCKQRDVLVEKLRERIKERDKALEHSIDEKFHCLEEHESQVRSLQLALREKERDLERLRCILSNNEDTITSLDSLIRSKDLELEQAAEAYRNLQWLKQHSEEKDKNSLKERDSIISQLQAALQARSQETQDLTAALVARVQTNEVIEELKARLSLKEKLFQELLSDRSRQSNEHLAQIQDLFNTISSKDQYLQDYSYRMWLVVTERTGQLHEIQKQLSLREQELCKLQQDKELGGDAENLKSLLKEKESLIKELIQSKEEALESSTIETEAKTSAMQEELHLLLKKEREAREELSALRVSLGHQQTAQQGSATKYSGEYQCVLDQLLSEYNSLNDALRAEKRLYQSLSQIHNRTDSVDKIQALHTELDSVQALRGQLEEVLARTRNMALMLDRAAKRPADLGELSSAEDKDSDDDCCSEEFSDSIEEEDCKMTTHSCTSIQASEIQQLEEERTTLEAELEEIQSQLERDGFSSLSQMRSTLRKLQQENCALKESHNQTDLEHCLSGQETEDELETEEEEDKESDEEEESPFANDQHQKRPNTLNLSSHNDNGAGLPACSKVPELWQDLEEGLKEQASRLRSDLALSCQENRELQERLMVSEATVHAQAEQLKDYRDLLAETSVKQASKHVQVDLQDLGYETCGRSENEAEREDASSPEFDDLEMCTALSQHQDYECEGRDWYAGNTDHAEPFNKVGNTSSLQHLVQDLRSQLTHCHKVIRGLQMRVRSLSATSDYASSLERTPRKVNWALAKSPVPSGVEEDEGWMSDPQGTRSRPSRNKELQELMERVASLETQLRNSRKDNKGPSEDAKCATWPGKYNSLIQAQARELSHLRQRIREGQGVCHILTQHLGDTTKAFEELLRSNDIDYYMGQSFREQLAQSSALAQRVVAKISGRGCTDSCDDKTATLLALRLSKELQQKDKIIESLHSKLQQRAETPSSCHALSETTDQSDRTSLVSDEFRGTEDLELYSEADRQEFQEEHRLQPGQFGSEQSVFLSHYSHRSLKSSNSCPNMLCSANFAGAPLPQHPFPSPYGPDVWGKELPAAPQPRALSVNAVRPELDVLYEQINEQSRGSFLSGDHNQLNIINHSQLSHHAFQQYQLGMPEDYSLKSDSGLVAGGPPWDLESKAPPTGSYSGLTEHPAGMHLIEEHLQEVKCLRQRLEESIRTNERLRQQLEERLASTGREGGAPTNIYIQGLDTVTQLSNEIRVLKEENLGLQSRLQSSSGEEVGQLRDAVFTAHARLKQAELEAEQWKEELRRVQIHSQEQAQQLNTLRQERQMNQEQTNRLQHDMSLLQQQLCESRDLIHSLQGELQVYDQVCARTNKGFLSELPILPVELAELLGEVRSLRAQLQNSIQENSTLKQLELHKQLEQKLGSPRTLCALTASPQRESFYKRQLLHDPAPSPPVRDIGLFNCGSPGPPYSDLEDCQCATNADTFDPHAELEGEAPDGSFANRNGRHVIGHVDDFTALQQQILEGCSLVHQIDSMLQSCQGSSLIEDQTHGRENVLDDSCITILFANTKTLRQIFEEAMSLLKMFWRAALPSTDASIQSLKKEQCLQEEILSLKLRVSEQEEVLKGTIQRLRSTSRTKESMEHFIVSQLSRTRDVLKKARTNLEKNELRLSSLSSSSSPYTAKEPGEAAREWSSDYGVMTFSCAANQRLVTRKRTSQCLL